MFYFVTLIKAYWNTPVITGITNNTGSNTEYPDAIKTILNANIIVSTINTMDKAGLCFIL